MSEALGPEHYTPLTHCIRVYSILIHTEKRGRGRVEPERRFESPINTCRKVPLKVLSSEIDPAEIRLIRKDFFKGMVAWVF